MSGCVAGREVSNRVVLGVLQVCRWRELPTAPLLEGLPLAEGLSDPRGRHAWGDFAVFMERLQDEAGGPLGLECLCGETIQTNAWMRLLGRLFVDARDLYVFGQERITRSLYSEAVDTTVRAPSSGLVEISIHIREPLRPSLPFWYATLGALRVYPRLIGQQSARVDGEITGRASSFRVSLPPARSLASRARRAFWEAAQLAGVAAETVGAAVEVGFEEGAATAAAQSLGQQLVSQVSEPALADELQRVMAGHFSGRSAQLWVCGDGGELLPLGGSAASLRSGGRTQRSLVFAGREVGRIEVDALAAEQSALFEALLPWITMAVENCRQLAQMGAARAKADKEADDGRLADREMAWSLTPREAEVLWMLARGSADKEIAASLSTSTKTVELHVSNLLRKAGEDSRAAMVARFWAGPQTPEQLAL